jgi:predicted secreted protein
MKFRFAVLCALSLLSFPVLAENQQYDQVDFSSSAEQEVANDLMTATLGIEVNDASPARVAQQVNATLNDALKKAAAFTAIKASSGSQRTYPVYGKNNRKPDSWRGNAEIRLEGRDFGKMGELIAQLQPNMQLQDVRFLLATETRQQIENSLITKAIDAFRQRAKAVSSAMGGVGYKIIHISINNGGYPRPMLGRAAMAEAIAPTPQFSGGESTMSVQVSGTIQVVRQDRQGLVK